MPAPRKRAHPKFHDVRSSDSAELAIARSNKEKQHSPRRRREGRGRRDYTAAGGFSDRPPSLDSAGGASREPTAPSQSAAPMDRPRCDARLNADRSPERWGRRCSPAPPPALSPCSQSTRSADSHGPRLDATPRLNADRSRRSRVTPVPSSPCSRPRTWRSPPCAWSPPEWGTQTRWSPGISTSPSASTEGLP